MAAAIAGGFVFAQYEHPVFYTRLVTEDDIGENATVFAFALTAAVLFALSLRSAAATPAQRWLWRAVALGSAFVAGEEFSWGQRVLGFRTPGAMREINNQGEFTIHNIDAFSELSYRGIASRGILAWCALSIFIGVLWPRLQERWERRGVPLISLPITPFLVLAPFFFLTSYVTKSSEVAELMLGLTAVVWAGDQYARYATTDRWTGGFSSAGSLATLTAIAILALLTSLRPSGGFPGRLNLMVSRDLPKLGLHRQSDAVFRFIYEHPEEHLLPSTRIHHARLLISRKREADAREILRSVIEAPRAGGDDDGSLADRRSRVAALTLLGEDAQADAELESALELDERRLEKADHADDRARVMWSMAMSLASRERIEEAAARALEAARTAEAAAVQWPIERWVYTLRKRAKRQY